MMINSTTWMLLTAIGIQTITSHAQDGKLMKVMKKEVILALVVAIMSKLIKLMPLQHLNSHQNQ